MRRRPEEGEEQEGLGRGAFGRVFAQQLQHKFPELRTHDIRSAGRDALGCRRRGAIPPLADQNLRQDDPEGEHIGRSAVLGVAAKPQQLVGDVPEADVQDRSDRVGGGRAPGLRDGLGGLEDGQHGGALGIDQDVGRLEIPVQKAELKNSTQQGVGRKEKGSAKGPTK